MKKVLIVAVALLTMLAFVTGVMAQEKKPAPAPEKAAPEKAAPAAPEKAPKAEKAKAPKAAKFSGTVAAFDAAAKTLKVKGKDKEMDFAVADDAKIKGDVKEGAKVSVSYKKDGDKNVATAISVASAKKAKGEKKAAAPKEEKKPAEEKK
jgi:hypothetical protein